MSADKSSHDYQKPDRGDNLTFPPVERFDRVSTWLTQPESGIPGVATRLARVAEGVHDYAALKSREAKSGNLFLSRYQP